MNIKVLAAGVTILGSLAATPCGGAEAELLRFVQSRGTEQLNLNRPHATPPSRLPGHSRDSGSILDIGRGLDTGRGLETSPRQNGSRIPAASGGQRGFEFGTGIGRDRGTTIRTR